MPPIPSVPANIPMARKITRMGIPNRDESELSKILAPTSTAPIKKRLFIVMASKVGGLLMVCDGESYILTT
jgi:hypothetical protein